MLLGIQVIAVLFAIVMIYFTHLYYRRGNYKTKSFALWLCVWLGVIFLLVIPNTLQYIASLLSLSRITDLYTAIAILFLVTMTFYMYTLVKKMERKMEKFVRTQAIKKVQKPKK
jgi:hypothetical protein